jgi:hypothetical protein
MEETAVVVHPLSLSECSENHTAPADLIAPHPSGHVVGDGSRTRRKRENVKIGNRESLDEIHGVLKLALCLTGETPDDINADTDRRKTFKDRLNQPPEPFPCIPPIHASENLVVSALERNMYVRTDPHTTT